MQGVACLSGLGLVNYRFPPYSVRNDDNHVVCGRLPGLREEESWTRDHAVQRLECVLRSGYGQGAKSAYSSSFDGRVRRRVVQCRNSVQSLQVDVPEAEKVQQYLFNIHNAMGLSEYSQTQHIIASGSQSLMNMEGLWSFIWCLDGRYYERYEGVELSFEWGYDGIHSPWSADAAGRVSVLDLDDREVCLLASWVRTGYWLTREGLNKVTVKLEPPKSGPFLAEIELCLHLKNSKVMAFLVVDSVSWLPLRLSIKAFGSEDKWEYCDWQPVQAGLGVKFPRSIIHYPPAGGSDVYFVSSVKLQGSSEETSDLSRGAIYMLPNTATVPRYTRSYPKTRIDDQKPPSVKMYQAESGHFLVRPLVDGQDIGYFIVDTGASSLTITFEAAESLNMYAFGEAFVTGVEGEVKCQLRRGKTLSIGPIQIDEPIFMEVPMAGVVRGISPVAGICGYDIFFHCVVEMSYKMGTISFYDPLVYYQLKNSREFQWQRMHLLENVPHVPAYFSGNEGIFLLDTGAGGVDVIFHGRSRDKYKLQEILEIAGTASVKGINTSGKGLQVQYGILSSLELAGVEFRKVNALFPAEGSGGSLDFSVYTAGVICGDLLSNLLIILDYGRRRFAVIQSKDVSIRSKI